ncbi:MAG: DegT/DnrJ/EryC1/StrS family aminotransferase [Deferribacteres bacterium]|nr:DegT/DnrJ/EryC1/StrS family aminotransferase [Deferribacteres bacterium]
MQVPFHRPYTTDDEINEVIDSIKSGWLTMGPKTVRFEEEFRDYIGSQYAISVNSCTAALHLALEAVGVQEDDEVIIPTMTFTATGEVVRYLRARPVIVDIDRDTHNIDPCAVEKAVTPGTKVIIPVHFAGQPCDMTAIRQIADGHGLTVVEDAAHSLPAWYRDEKVGTIGDLTCFSFYATKTLSTGEGGMITTGNDEWAERIKILRLHGISNDAWDRYSDKGSWYYEVVEAGYKYNMTDIQSGLGLAQLRKIDWMRERRNAIAEKYTSAFRDSGVIIPPPVRPDRTSSWHLYVIKLNLEALIINRDGFIEKLKQKGISTSVHFIPLHRHPYYRNALSLDAGSFENAEWVYERSISLPIYPGMTDEEVEYVAEKVMDVAEEYKR